MSFDVDPPVTRLKTLNQRASDLCTCDHNIPVKMYLRSSKEMERMAMVYADENEHENCFLLYMKLITLLVEKLPKHPQYRVAGAEEKKVANKRCKNAIQAAEKVKVLLKEKFEKEYNNWLLQEEQRKKAEEAERVRQQQLEEERRKVEEKQREELRKKTELLKVVPPTSSNPPHPTASSTVKDAPSFPSVPTVSHHQPPAPQQQQPPPPQPVSSHSLPPPSQPPGYNDPPPPHTNGSSTNHVPAFDRSSKPSQNTMPGVDRSTKPEERWNDSSIDGNRRVVMSPDLVPRFLQLAHRNTVQNLETCGILTGKLSRNVFRISHLVIPKQSATPDSCTTECEEEMFEVQDKHDLITLGWIHTHPSQTAFLSSVDLHTQCSYQQLMPEAIAIVCSPKYQTVGVYRLTPSYGVQYISSCTKSGFHPHPKEPPLYEESPLVSVDNGLTIEIIDLR